MTNEVDGKVSVLIDEVEISGNVVPVMSWGRKKCRVYCLAGIEKCSCRVFKI